MCIVPGRARIRVMGVSFDPVTSTEAVRYLVDAAATGSGAWMITANLDHLRRGRRESLALSLLRDASCVVADGMPVVWASRIAGCPLPERVAGSEMFERVMAEAARAKLRVFLLGGAPGVALAAADLLSARHPELEIVGADSPQLSSPPAPEEIEAVSEALGKSGANLVLAAFGFPKQDLLIRELRRLHPSMAFVGIGISLSFVIGDVAKAPAWLAAVGLEWAHRLAQEPRRLAGRYLRQGLPFAGAMFMTALRHRIHRSPDFGVELPPPRNSS
jgi:N-acetylglucosaminyldiphosphoundecaprenol N-acetyl-beta-D-mannosaminyltransferase